MLVLNIEDLARIYYIRYILGGNFAIEQPTGQGKLLVQLLGKLVVGHPEDRADPEVAGQLPNGEVLGAAVPGQKLRGSFHQRGGVVEALYLLTSRQDAALHLARNAGQRLGGRQPLDQDLQ